MSSSIDVYISTTSGNQEIKKHQQKIFLILDSMKINYNKLDVATDSDLVGKMREIIDNEKALPPQICNGDTYCGDYEAFEMAIEEESLEEFLQLK